MQLPTLALGLGLGLGLLPALTLATTPATQTPTAPTPASTPTPTPTPAPAELRHRATVPGHPLLAKRQSCAAGQVLCLSSYCCPSGTLCAGNNQCYDPSYDNAAVSSVLASYGYSDYNAYYTSLYNSYLSEMGITAGAYPTAATATSYSGSSPYDSTDYYTTASSSSPRKKKKSHTGMIAGIVVAVVAVLAIAAAAWWFLRRRRRRNTTTPPAPVTTVMPPPPPSQPPTPFQAQDQKPPGGYYAPPPGMVEAVGDSGFYPQQQQGYGGFGYAQGQGQVQPPPSTVSPVSELGAQYGAGGAHYVSPQVTGATSVSGGGVPPPPPPPPQGQVYEMHADSYRG